MKDLFIIKEDVLLQSLLIVVLLIKIQEIIPSMILLVRTEALIQEV